MDHSAWFYCLRFLFVSGLLMGATLEILYLVNPRRGTAILQTLKSKVGVGGPNQCKPK